MNRTYHLRFIEFLLGVSPTIRDDAQHTSPTPAEALEPRLQKP